jgi:hypothetical protein
VFRGTSVPAGNKITVPKGQTCFALAVFKTLTSSSSSDVGTIQWPTIPKEDWPQIFGEMMKEAVADQGAALQYVSARLISAAGPDAAKGAVASIDKRIEGLGKMKAVMSGLASGT